MYGTLSTWRSSGRSRTPNVMRIVVTRPRMCIDEVFEFASSVQRRCGRRRVSSSFEDTLNSVVCTRDATRLHAPQLPFEN